MTTQPQLWGHANTDTVQRDLFAGLPVVIGVHCCECGTELVESGDYWVCPRAHGRLLLAVPVDVPAELWNGEG